MRCCICCKIICPDLLLYLYVMTIKSCMLYLTAEIVIALGKKKKDLLAQEKKKSKNTVFFCYQEENTNACPMLHHIIIYHEPLKKKV
ncbi:hypothetical protein GDO81_002756 [Engystomops pustulosus]|uniref:Secreted protein n=1 Tax=Engystomops pustulosus TaxID=76066 RepID=A0AAV7DQM0_ENGPU|nr:hypothetical protein GDO81_002756 [Engystomops pustulosus]